MELALWGNLTRRCNVTIRRVSQTVAETQLPSPKRVVFGVLFCASGPGRDPGMNGVVARILTPWAICMGWDEIVDGILPNQTKQSSRTWKFQVAGRRMSILPTRERQQ